MVDNVFFVLQIVGIVVLLYWAFAHDRKGEEGAHRGLLAMRRPKKRSDDRTSSRQQRPRRHGSRADSDS